ncbi:PIN domain-containing protein [Halopenitus persicus]|uniref:PIN domain-containing protein n=1 Tax=Halopenitus persicus TaxID=1048396 RepID=UPI00210DB8A3|nr:PIN domain-containing protein [Halopenitus persicus]
MLRPTPLRPFVTSANGYEDLIDTNVLVAAVTRDTNRSDEAIELLDQADDPLVSVLSLMELRSVLSKRNGSNGIELMRSRIELRPE